MAESKISDIIRNSLENIRTIVDASVIIGNPIDTESGTTIIPVSKVSVGFASGGVDFQSKVKDDANFGGGGGTGLTVLPVAFLVVKADGDVSLLNIENGGGTDIAGIVDKMPDVITKLKGLFKKNKKDKTDDTDDADAESDFPDPEDLTEA